MSLSPQRIAPAPSSRARDQVAALRIEAKELGPLSAAVLVLPLVERETALDVHRVALVEVLGHDLGGPAPGGAVHEDHFLLVLVLVVHRQAELADGDVALGLLNLDVAGEVADEDDSVH